jgi:ABC-type sulfate transport system substrate-binding protein
MERHRDKFPDIRLFPITTVEAAGWDAANDRFFKEGAVFDRIYARDKK